MSDAQAIVDRAVHHAGGAERWDGLEALDVHLRLGGLAFRMAGALDRVADIDLVVFAHAPRVEISSRLQPGWRGVFDAGAAFMEDASGNRGAARSPAVRVQRAPWPRTGWDDLDIVAFCGYAAWNYLTFPVLLRRPDARLKALGRHRVGGEQLDGLQVRFPPGVPTHGLADVLWFTPGGALRRHDYRARMIAPWALAANVVLEEQTAFGITVPCRRRVTPQLPLRRAAPAPLLVSIDLEVTGARDRSGAASSLTP